MTFRQFVINNVRRNPKVYGPYFFSSFFAVMMFFVYALLVFHPDFAGQIESVTANMSILATIGFQISQVIIVIFSSFSIYYAVSAFLKTRKYEFGILLIQGISKKQLVRLVFMENCLTGFASILCGILFGAIFSKVILLACSNILAFDKTLPFYFPWKPIAVTFIVFSLMFLLISALATRTVQVENIRALIESERKPKKTIKESLFLACLAILLIAAGYFIVLNFTRGLYLQFLPLFSGVILVIIGTYFFFSQLLIFVLHFLRRREPFYFRKTHLLILSELIYRMRDNVRTCFIVTIISATAITAVGTSTAIGNSALAAEISSPYAITYWSDRPLDPKLLQKTEKYLNDSGVTDYRKVIGTDYVFYSNTKMIKRSDYNRLLALQDEHLVKLKDNESILVPYTSSEEKLLQSGRGPRSIALNGRQPYTFKVKAVTALNRFPLINFSLTDPEPFVIVVDDRALNQLLKTTTRENVTSSSFAVFHTQHWEKTLSAARKIEASSHVSMNSVMKNGNFLSFDSLALNWQRTNQLNGLLLLLTVLCGVVFYTFTAGFIFLRLYSDQKRDEAQYRMLSHLGLKMSELKKVVSSQLLFIFFIPLVIAIIHSGVAFIALQSLIHYSVFGGAAIVIGIFTITQTVYYLIIRHRYINLMQRATKA